MQSNVQLSSYIPCESGTKLDGILSQVLTELHHKSGGNHIFSRLKSSYTTVSGEITISVSEPFDNGLKRLIEFQFNSVKAVSRFIGTVKVQLAPHGSKISVKRDIIVTNAVYLIMPGIDYAVSFEYFVDRHLFLKGNEASLSVTELEHKYLDINGGFHPIYERDHWVKATKARNAATNLGYWDWVRYQIMSEGVDV